MSENVGAPVTESAAPPPSVAVVPATTGALTTTADATAPTATTSNTTTNANSNSNMNYSSGYGSGYGGYDPYGMGMGYGGMGMGYGGMGMMGYGGMGMMGMPMGMGMYGMTPEAQRGQMMMFMISSMVQLWGMLSQVVQGTLGSVVQFVGNYVGLNQKLAHVDEEALVQEEQYRRRCLVFKKELENVPLDVEEIRHRERQAKIQAMRQKPSWLRRIVSSVLRHSLLLLFAYFSARRITTLLSKKASQQLL